MRDFYDVYLFFSKDWNNINKEHLKMAIKYTFTNRNNVINLLNSINIIINSEVLKTRWINYQNRYDYAKEIDYDTITKCLLMIMTELGII